ncbi:MAG: MFS transporter [Candidatus Heimdallarchaeaceae archaeon]
MSIHEVKLHSSRRANIGTLVVINLLSGLVVGFYNVLLQPYLVRLIEITGKHENPEVFLGLVMTISAILQIVPMIFAAKLSDKVGRKRIIVASFLFYVFAMFLFGLSGNLTVKYSIKNYSLSISSIQEEFVIFKMIKQAIPVTSSLAIAILGLSLISVGIGFNDPPLQALIAESSEKKKQTSSFSLINLAFFSTGLIGPLVIRIFASKIDLNYYFYGIALGRMLIFIYALFALKEPLIVKDYKDSFLQQFIQSMKIIPLMLLEITKSIALYLSIPAFLARKRRKEKKLSKYFVEVETNLRLFKEIFKNPGVPYAILFFILDALTWGLSTSIFWGSVVLVYDFNESHISILQLAYNLSTLLFFIPVTKFSDKLKKNELLVLSEITGSLFFTCNIIAYFTHPSYRIYAIMLGWIGIGASVAFWVPSILSIMTNFDKRRRAEVYGMVSGLHQMGWIPVSIISGLIISHINFLAIFIISLILFPFNVWMAMKFPTDREETEKTEKNKTKTEIRKGV